MQIILESTEQLVHLNGVQARVWVGTTASGTPVHAFITRLALGPDAPAEVIAEFEQQLQAHLPPLPELEVYPARMFIP